jgi:hypothetical protein
VGVDADRFFLLVTDEVDFRKADQYRLAVPDLVGGLDARSDDLLRRDAVE